MKNTDKIKEQLKRKVAVLRKRIADLEQSEKVLRESEEELKAIFNDGQIGIAIFDMTGKILRVNKQILEVGKYTEKEIVGKRIELLKMFPKKSIAKMLANFTKLISGKNVPPFDVEVHTKGGEKLITELHGFLLKKKKRAAGMVGIMHDVTEQRRTGDALRESEEELEAIFNDVRDGIVVLDLTGKIIKINKRITERTEYTEKDLVGKRFAVLKMLTPQSIAKMIASFPKTIAGRQGTPYEVEGYSKTGKKMIGEIYGALLRKRGKVTGVVAVMRDITERKQTEELLKTERETFYSTLQESPNGVALIDKDGRYLYINPQFTIITGYTLQDVPTGRDWFHKAYPEPEYRRQIITMWKKDFDRKAIDRILSVTCNDGEVRAIEFKGTVLKDDRAIVILTDITERKRAEEAYHAVVEQSLQGLHIIQDQREVFVNSAYAEMLGYTVEELLALSPKQVRDLVHPEDRETIKKYYQNRLADIQQHQRYEFRVIRKDGSKRWVEAFPSRIDYQGRPAVQVAMVDITERKKAEATLRNSEERYRTLVESSTDAILMLDRERNIVTCNQAFLKLFGYKKGEVEDKSTRIIHPSEESFRSYGKTAYTLIERVGSLREEWNLKRKDGTIFSAEIVTSPVRASDGTTTGYICIIRDITERKRAEEELEYMATHDVLTGLPNRTLFNDRLALALNHAQRFHNNLAVMLLDLDYFKDVNDTLGHTMGDQLLHAVGVRLTELLRKGDTVARSGGDEFLLLLPEMTQVEYANTIAKKILQGFRQPFSFDDHQLHITTSIGIAIYPDDGNDADTLVKNADSAMYHAKQKGRDNFQSYTSV
ncbi:MAG: PAS domain S-box protein [Deltaproteobacteria bacterium]|nr:PAS domain S-box protein [Deltaproteobacteria bacterium]